MTKQLVKCESKTSINLVFVAGNSCSYKVFENIPFKYLSFSCNVFAIDLQYNKGLSSIYLVEYSFSNLVTYILEQIKRLDGDIILIGHSLGGHLSLRAATQIPKLKGIILLGVSPLKKGLNITEAFNPNAPLGTYYSENPSYEEIDHTLSSALYDQNYLPLLKEEFNNADSIIRGKLGEELALAELHPDELQLFQELNIQKQMICGADDVFINLQYIKEICEFANAELTILQNCGHYPHLEQADGCIKVINNLYSKRGHTH